MIEVTRKDFLPRRRKDGSKVLPHYECTFRYNRMQVAFYNSLDGTLYLRTDLIGQSSKESAYRRALTCGCAEAYEHIFDKLGINESSRISEY